MGLPKIGRLKGTLVQGLGWSGFSVSFFWLGLDLGRFCFGFGLI